MSRSCSSARSAGNRTTLVIPASSGNPEIKKPSRIPEGFFVGGIAINLHGFLRSTADLDILVEMADANLKKVVGILKKKGYRVRQPVDPMSIANQETRLDWIHNKNMKAFNFYKENEYKEVDIIIESPVSYSQVPQECPAVEGG